ncbi:hypothetical protein PAXRUDRAFT_36300 [Paxillus rubicundulus Ve08.2h10]|uniref:Unplaced genomic scaffold scaffold_1297, whole genome shotgun sequence n=1 Tax=Paxillus rubicundulus Ve08.2h10 TaxID=930991 RepID=A0A0D0CB08_9AGAM|nr:hypothetical protein PAXRUDRAFT_36300 [Paxillus rubicundulus Ve08.2h10]
MVMIFFHYEPYKPHWDLAHNSQAFIEAHQKLLDLPQEAGCNFLQCIAGMMFYSAKLWLLSAYFGNESKYLCCQPTSHLCSHVAYFWTLPDAFKDFVMENTRGMPPSDTLLTYYHRELFHAPWCILLDDEFFEAYQHSIVIACCDQIKHQVYPQIFTYSSDYLEKYGASFQFKHDTDKHTGMVLIATVRNLGTCPGSHCLIPKTQIHLLATEMGMLDHQCIAHSDTPEQCKMVSSSHKLIYKMHYAVDSVHVKALLKDKSLIPTMNTFSQMLGHTGFDFFIMLVVNLLHKFELGLWKAILIHLLCILNSLKKPEISELDQQ